MLKQLTHSARFKPKVFITLPDLELKTVDFGKVTIRGEKTKAYVAVNAQGELCVAVSFFQ